MQDDVTVQGDRPPRGKGTNDSLDTGLNVALVVVAAAIIGLVGVFAWSVYQASAAEKSATPALRVVLGLRQQVKKSPNDPMLRSRLAEGLAAAGMLDEAAEELAVAVKIDPKFVGGYQNLGVVSMARDDRVAAKKAFEKVLKLTEGSDYEQINQRREIALYYLGEIALDAKRYEDAVANFKAALRIRKDASDTYLRLAQAFRGLDEDDAALEQLEAALTFDPNFPEANYEYGRLLLDRGDKAGAAERFRKAADGAPNIDEPQQAIDQLGSLESWITRAEEALAEGSATDAVDAARVAHAIDPQNLSAMLVHGKALEKAGRPKDALKAYKTALDIAPDNAELKAAIERVEKQTAKKKG